MTCCVLISKYNVHVLGWRVHWVWKKKNQSLKVLNKLCAGPDLIWSHRTGGCGHLYFASHKTSTYLTPALLLVLSCFWFLCRLFAVRLLSIPCAILPIHKSKRLAHSGDEHLDFSFMQLIYCSKYSPSFSFPPQKYVAIYSQKSVEIYSSLKNIVPTHPLSISCDTTWDFTYW